MKTCAIVAEPIACRGVRVVVALKNNHVLGMGWAAGAVHGCAFWFFSSHTSQFNASNRKWSTAEVLNSAYQYTQEQCDRVKR